MNYPVISEYIEAIKSAKDNFDELWYLRPVLNEDGEPIMSSGNFAAVFKMQDEQTGKLHAVKCFLREQEGRAEAYRMIAEELEYVSSTFLTPIRYLDKELFVDTTSSDETEFPVLLMDWVEGITLDKYIRQHIDNQYELSLLAYQFSRLAMWLLPQPFAHGDMKPDNILVKNDGTLTLVDYDGMYVPAMRGQKARELGSPDFRHPLRTDADFDEHIDDFSIISILLSLKAIALQPDFLIRYGASDRLLFSEKDYLNLSESKVMDALKSLIQDIEVSSLYSLFILAFSHKNLSQVSFRLFNLERPKEPELTDADFDAWVYEMEADYAQSQYEAQYEDWIEECLSLPNEEKVWPLLTFARQHGKMQVGEFMDKETGVTFNSCIFTRPDGIRTFVDFSSKLGELTPKEIASQKDELYVIQRKSGNYSLCKRDCKREDVDKNQQEEFSTQVTEEDLANAWTDEYGVKYSSDRTRLLKAPYNLHEYDIRKGTIAICYGAFEKCTMLANITIPNSVIIIGEASFFRCESIDNISIPNSVVIIKEFAFSGCSNLTNLNIPDTVTSIGELAFNGCTSLDNMYIPHSVLSIGDGVFRGCIGLAKIIVDKNNTTYDSRESCNAIIERASNRLIAGCKNTIIPNTVSIIGARAFEKCKTLTRIHIPDSVISIESSAFDSCYSLRKINIPDSVTSIGDYAFQFCSKLANIILPNSVTSIGDSVFFACESFTEIMIPNTVIKFGKDVFEGCDKLETILIPVRSKVKFEKLLPDYKDKLVEQDNNKQNWREYLDEVLNNAYRSSYDDHQNFWLDNDGVTYSPDKKRLLGIPYYLNEYCIREGTEIVFGSRNDDSMLSTITIPSSVISIEGYAFCGCSCLSTIKLAEGLLKIGNAAFAGCGMQSILLPNSLKVIGQSAFGECDKLKSIVIPKGVVEIGKTAFYVCESLATVSLPSSLEIIGDDAFLFCDSLERIIIPIGSKRKFEKMLPDYKDILIEE